MIDLVSKSSVLDIYAELYDVFDDNKAIQKELDKVYDKLRKLKEQETIVRCKDCKYAVLTYQGELKYCKYFVEEYGFTNGGDPLYLEGDFFCAAAKRGEVE